MVIFIGRGIACDVCDFMLKIGWFVVNLKDINSGMTPFDSGNYLKSIPFVDVQKQHSTVINIFLCSH